MRTVKKVGIFTIISLGIFGTLSFLLYLFSAGEMVEFEKHNILESGMYILWLFIFLCFAVCWGVHYSTGKGRRDNF